MRRGIALLLALCLCVLVTGASATSFTLAGFDTVSSGHDWANNLFFSRMEKKTGVSLQLIQYTDESDFTRYKQRLLSGSERPDGLIKAALTGAETLALYEAGVLIDLSPLLEENAPNLYALLEAHPDWRAAITLPDGAIAALPQINTLPTNNVLWINTRWLKLLGLNMPTTTEELTAVLRAFKTSDPNRNNKADEIPLTFTGLWDLRFFAGAFGLLENDYGISWDGQEAQATLPTDENRALLTWLHTLWEEELIDHNGFTTSDSVRRITDSSADITYGAVFGPSVLSYLPTNAIADYEPLLPLNGGVWRSLFGEVIPGTFAITSACADPAALLRWVDTLYTDEGLYLAYVGQEGSEYTITSDGYWYWNDTAETVSSTVLTDCTIGEGVSLPGLVTREYQLMYDDEQTVNTVRQLCALADVSSLAVPPVYLTGEQEQALNSTWLAVSQETNNQMARFITGDDPLDDAHWAAFVDEVNCLGMPQVLSIFTQALSSRR